MSEHCEENSAKNMKEGMDFQKATGMCPHGNFPSRCETCVVEGEQSVETDTSQYVSSFEARIEGLDHQEMTAEQRELERSALRMFVDLFAKPTQEVLDLPIEIEGGSATFRDVLQKHIQNFDDFDGEDEERGVMQLDLLRDLVSMLKEMDVGTWDSAIEQTAKTKKNNCSGSAALLTTMIEATSRRTGIDADYVNPYGHALVVAKLADGRIIYADGRNGVLEDVSDVVDYEEREDFNVYGLRKQTPEIPFRFLPTTKENWRLIVENYAGNMEELPDAAEGAFDDVLQNTATADELEKIQSEAIAALAETGITREEAQKLRRVKDHLEGGLQDFRKSPDFGAESELWKQIHAGQEHLRQAGEKARSIDGMMQRIRARKGELRAFLLGESDHFDSGDQEIDENLRKYRDARESARIILHKSDDEVVTEVDALIDRL